jgi:hypothetical protein
MYITKWNASFGQSETTTEHEYDASIDGETKY